MGIGAHLTQYIKDKDVLHRFIEIELLVGIIGGISALALFVAFGLSAAPFRTLLYAFVLIVGMVVGMEIPLVMRVLNQKGAEFKELVSKVLTFDYLGALAVSLLFPLLLAPKLGMARSALLFGIFNAAVAYLTARVFKSELPRYHAIRTRAFIVLTALITLFIYADRISFKPNKAISAIPSSIKAILPTNGWSLHAGKTIPVSISTATCNSPHATKHVTMKHLFCLPCRWCPMPNAS